METQMFAFDLSKERHNEMLRMAEDARLGIQLRKLEPKKPQWVNRVVKATKDIVHHIFVH